MRRDCDGDQKKADVTGAIAQVSSENFRQGINTSADNLIQGKVAGVRVVTPQGLQAMTDQYGRYHITCAVTPNESRGSNFALKLDDRTLPSGFRLSALTNRAWGFSS